MSKDEEFNPLPRPVNGNVMRIPWELVERYESMAIEGSKRAGVPVSWTKYAEADMRAARGLGVGAA
jgi:hypothetical protein